MFPHVSPEAIRYDLARSGSAEATADRILSEGALPNVSCAACRALRVQALM
jgi:hypothetical protein